jgi:hypothetical protein
MRGQDVDEFLSQTTPEKFDELVAMDRIVPFGDEKLSHVMALVGAAIVERLDVILRRWCDVKDLPKVKPASFIPWKKKKKKKKTQEYVNPNAAAAAFKLRMGR